MHAIIANGKIYQSEESIEEYVKEFRSETKALFLNGKHADFEMDQWCTIGVHFPRVRKEKKLVRWGISLNEICKEGGQLTKRVQ